MARRRRSGLGASSSHHKHESAAAVRRATISYRRAIEDLQSPKVSCAAAFDNLIDGVSSESVARAEYASIERSEREHEYLRIDAGDHAAFTRPFDLFRRKCLRTKALAGLAGMRRSKRSR